MKKLLPDSVFTKEGALSFPRLRTLLFTEPERKKHLEELIHPLVFQEVSKRNSEAKITGRKACGGDRFAQSGFSFSMRPDFLSGSIGRKPLSTLDRKSGLNKEEALRIIQSQSVERFREKAQLVINTEESIERVRDEICQYFQRI